MDLILVQHGDAWPWVGDVVRNNSDTPGQCYRLVKIGMPHEGLPAVFEGRRWRRAQGVLLLNYEGVIFDAGCYRPAGEKLSHETTTSNCDIRRRHRKSAQS